MGVDPTRLGPTSMWEVGVIYIYIYICLMHKILALQSGDSHKTEIHR